MYTYRASRGPATARAETFREGPRAEPPRPRVDQPRRPRIGLRVGSRAASTACDTTPCDPLWLCALPAPKEQSTRVYRRIRAHAGACARMVQTSHHFIQHVMPCCNKCAHLLSLRLRRRAMMQDSEILKEDDNHWPAPDRVGGPQNEQGEVWEDIGAYRSTPHHGSASKST